MIRRGLGKGASIGAVLVAAILVISIFFVVTTFRTTHVQEPVCTSSDPRVADPKAPHGLFVNAANSPQSLSNESEILKYILPDSTVCGANLIIPWSSIDMGPGANPRYNWAFVDQSAEPWIKAGKIVNFIVWGAAEQTSQEYNGTSMTPSYVLKQVDTVKCGPDPITPVYWEAGYLDNYEAFIQALVQHYGNAPWLGYIRFGIGTGGEDYPENGFDLSPCLSLWQSHGYSMELWQNYSLQLMKFEYSLGSPKTILVGLNQIQGQNGVADAVATAAVRYGFGFGIQGFSINQEKVNSSGSPCYADWCALFKEYAGKVPLELQTTTHTYPDGTGVGSLVQLAPFGLASGAQIFELYPQEWLIADDPSFPGYTQYHAAYSEALDQMASVVGYSASNGTSFSLGYSVPPYTVVGNRILDGWNRTFVPYGVELPSLWIPNWHNNQLMQLDASILENQTVYSDARYFWHSNTVVVKVASEDLFDQSPYDASYLHIIDTIVSETHDYDLNLIIALQYESTTKQPLPTQDSESFWKLLSSRYYNDSWVFFDVFNEPRSPFGVDNSTAWNMWRDGGTYAGTNYIGMQNLVDIVRSNHAQNLVFVDGLAAGEDLNGVPGHMLSGQNIIYAVHPYFGPLHDNESEWNFWFGDAAKSIDAPVVADEWGEYQSSTHGECIASAPVLVPQFLQYLKDLNIGVIGYGLYPGILIRGWNFTAPTSFDQSPYTCPDTTFPNLNTDAQGVGVLLVSYFSAND